MRVLVDTSVWSLALRRPPASLNEREAAHVAAMRRFIDEFRILMIGPVRQELLSGVRHRDQFKRLRDRLRAFPDEPLESADYERAAEMGNLCRGAGLAVSSIDLLICAVSIRRDAPLLTTDTDFTRYATVLPLQLLLAPEGRPFKQLLGNMPDVGVDADFVRPADRGRDVEL